MKTIEQHKKVKSKNSNMKTIEQHKIVKSKNSNQVFVRSSSARCRRHRRA
jgi:hypothetical protein